MNARADGHVWQERARATTGSGLRARVGRDVAPGCHPRTAQNVVIEAPREAEPPGRARLRVDESHPHFFDHPLDHVSGILLLEGMLQLLETNRVAGGGLLRELHLRFPRFAEKDRPISLELDGERAARAIQDGRVVLEMTFEPEHHARGGWRAFPRRTTVPPANASQVHKSNPDNVLVGAWSVKGDVVTCPLLDPPEGHLLAEGDPQHFSAHYALETVRQLVTGLGHSVYRVPVGMPMVLLAVDLFLEEALPRHVPLALRHALLPLALKGRRTLARFKVEILAADVPIGECRLKALVLTDAAHEEARRHGGHDAQIGLPQ